MNFDEATKQWFRKRAKHLRSERERYTAEGRVVMAELCDISINVYESVV